MNPLMAEVQTISISDLLSLSRPLSGAASITPSSCFPSLKKHKPNPPPLVPKNSITETLLTDKINGLKPSFAPFNRPVLLVGTVDLPADPDDQLLSFSDGSSSISCNLLDLDLKVIGCRIQVLAWNFIPFKQLRGGLLEIVRWCFLPLLATESEKSVLPLRKAVHSASRKCIVGVLRAVSPVFTVPWRNQLRGVDSIGFLVEMVTCKCNVCSSSSSFDGPIEHNCNLAPEFVYFLQSSSRWRLVLAKVVGKVISLSGLKEKLIFVGESASYSMLVTTMETAVSPSFLFPDFMQHGGMCSRGMFEEEACYLGVITGVYMQGMAVELDGKVWLLVCDPNPAPEFSLRNGALISVRNFQLVHTGFSWIQIDMLVCWCKTNINIMAFSVCDTRTYFIRSLCQSLLGKFIKSLTPTAKFWCHQKEGLVQAYARASLSMHFIQSQQGIFTEFCNHGQPTVNHECKQPLLKLIVPISYLMSKCEVIWTSIIKKMLFHEGNLVTSDSMVESPCKGVPSLVRRIISSDDLGCILMGHFKCTSSGKLQLVDGTGNVDVVVPDMLSSFHCQGIHEIRKFELVIEGPSMQFELLQLPCAEPLSCKNIFGQLTTKKISNQLTVYVHFYLEDSICLNAHSDHPCMASGCNTIPEGIIHLFRVTHKFPANKFPMFNSVPSVDSSLFAEALLLPYDAIFLDDLNRGPCDIFQRKISGWPAYECNLNDHEKGWSKRVKFVDPLDKGSAATKCHLEQAEVGAVFPFLGFSISSSPQIPHFAGYLCHKGGNVLKNMHASFGTLLLEFFSDGFMKYQSLQLGGYYMVKCSKECPLCSKKIDKRHCFTKISLSSQTTLWKVSFSFVPTTCQGELRYYTAEDFLVGDYLAFFRNTDQNGLLFQPSSKEVQGISDVHLVISNHLLAVFNQGKAMEEALFSYFSMSFEVLTVSSIIKIMKSNLLTLRSSRCAGLTNEGLRHSRFITLQGIIKSMHMCKYMNKFHLGEENTYHCDSSYDSICLHVYDSQNMIRIQGKLHKNAFPVGMGPGANATFHRVLLKGCSGGFPKLFLTSVSFIVINCVKETNLQWDEKMPTLLSECGKGEEHPHFILLCLISQFEQFMNAGLGRLLCRVVTIQLLVLEKLDLGYGWSESSRRLRMASIKIPLAGFLLDDGSSLCCCWADAERAKMLLRLEDVLCQSFFLQDVDSVGQSDAYYDTIGYHLEMMLKKHVKIIVRNNRTIPDDSPLDFTFSADSGEVLSNAEECLLRYIIINACQGSTFNVIGCMMDSTSLDLFDREGEKWENAMGPLSNIWAADVLPINPLKQARNLLDELSR